MAKNVFWGLIFVIGFVAVIGSLGFEIALVVDSELTQVTSLGEMKGTLDSIYYSGFALVVVSILGMFMSIFKKFK